MSESFEHRLRVRYGETDQMGVVHHPNYLLYFEEARTAYMAHMGLPYGELERSGVGLAVRKLDLRYRGSAVFEDELCIRVTVGRIGAASVEFRYEVVRLADSALLATGSTELACIDLSREDRKPRLLPEELRALLDPAG
ncbi:MAG: acyl-CoA thioesterase [Planctomycetota bacterium]|nr:MAG: acyl-CoA thioesterase [Planctomycetota bacterium]